MASNSSSPEPPVPLKNSCSIIHDNVLYVYSPDAFQTLSLTKNATWKQEPNGVSVTGALCVKGGIDGNSDNPALYVVGGTTNSSVTNYSGIQRYSISSKTWATINPITAVTANRINHGATYLNASSAVLVYGGSQNGVEADSTETFLMLMYPPYRVQAYSSAAPPVIRPFVLPWSDEMAVMVGGGSSNQRIFTFHPNPGWVDLGLALPNSMPDTSVAQCALQMLDDGSKILQTFDLSQSPNVITRNVLLGPGGNLASYGQTVGDSTNSASPAQSTTPSRIMRKRQASLDSYPAYNNSNAPSVTRSNFALATGNSNLVAAVGGDSQDSVNVFDLSANSWLSDQAVFGKSQIPLTSSTSISSSQTASPTATSPPAASSSAASDDGGSQTNGLAILGGVLGGICGLAAILIIILLYLRSIKRKRAMDAAKKQHGSPYPDDKPKTGNSFEEGGTQPLSAQAQPMGRSPVSSTIIDDSGRDSVAMFSGRFNEKAAEAGTGPHGSSKLSHQRNASGSMSSNFFKKEKEKGPLQISRPMLPDLGDYQARPSIDLGKATPAVPVLPVIPAIAAATAVTAERKADQRKTDEGWAQYFTEDKDTGSDTRPNSRPSTAKGGGGGFWPGSGVPQNKSNRSTKLPMRDSAGNLLNNLTVNTSNPSEVAGQEHSRMQPRSAVISRAESLSTSHSSDDDDYEDDHMDAYASGIPESIQDHHAWTPVGNTWSGPAQRPVRAPSVSIGASAFPPPTGLSENTTNTSTSGSSGIPAFPLSHASMQKVGPQSNTGFAGITTVQHPTTSHFASNMSHSRKSSANGIHGGPAVQDYFGPGPSEGQTGGRIPDNTDTSWVDLGTPARGVAGSSSSGEDHEQA